MRKIIQPLFKVFEILLSPVTYLSAVWFKIIVRIGIKHAPVSEKIFMGVGILPVRDHYYEPIINPRKHLRSSLREERILPGIDFNVNAQLQLLSEFKYNEELVLFPLTKRNELEYYYNNITFGSGDSEYLYNIIRHFRPACIIEIGSGNSTLIARSAIKKNNEENSNYTCEHICIEPYEQPWLEKLDAKIIREKVEDIDRGFFDQLKANDILFIDSSHIIRPQGDVLFEYLTLLPGLNSGVIIHIHDIFSPRDYLDQWVYESHIMWNEQYLLEAFLSMNDKFEVIGSLNYLRHNYRNAMAGACPVFAKQPDREPGSFWIRRK